MAAALDTYTVQARLAPALLAALPASLLAGVWTADAWTALTGVVTGLGAAVALAFLFTQLSRSAGKKVELAMVQRLGGLPTTLALRHGGPVLNPMTRSRYHAFLSGRSGCRMPSQAEQAADQNAADDCYASGVDWLRKHANDRNDVMVMAELMSYGFRRNLVGARPWALVILAACLTLNGVALYYAYQGGADLLVPGFVLEILFVIALPMWVMIGPGFAEEGAWSYARRLLSLCEGDASAA